MFCFKHLLSASFEVYPLGVVDDTDSVNCFLILSASNRNLQCQLDYFVQIDAPEMGSYYTQSPLV